MSESNPAAELAAFIAKGLVGQTDVIKVNVLDDGRLLELETAEEDRGRVIGRQGRVANLAAGSRCLAVVMPMQTGNFHRPGTVGHLANPVEHQ